MKLLFPNGEHTQTLLNEGITRIGSQAGLSVVLSAPGIEPVHCELELNDSMDAVRVCLASATAKVTINGVAVQGEGVARAGDLLAFGGVQSRLVAVEAAGSAVATKRTPAVDANGATRLRMAIPKYVLRGVSGAVFGKVFPVGKEQVIGRQQDCDIPVPAEEVSRQHCRIKPAPDGLLVEDLGSANGTYIDGKRIQSAFLKPGGELRLDSIRFMLVVPGAEIGKNPAAATEAPVEKSPRITLLVTLALIVAAGAAAAYFLLH